MADQDKLRKRLEALLKLPDNILCADCKKRGMNLLRIIPINIIYFFQKL